MKTRIVRIGNSLAFGSQKPFSNNGSPEIQLNWKRKTNSGSDWDKTEWSRSFFVLKFTLSI